MSNIKFRAVVASEKYDFQNERRFRTDIESSLSRVDVAIDNIVNMRGGVVASTIRTMYMMAPLGVKIYG